MNSSNPSTTGGTGAIAYRRDVDGLRAVAVLLVVFDHVHTRLTGGYIGVDVFFVISGYLISSLILSEMAAGRFSIATFYERRLRRIFPALLAMLMGTSAIAYTLLIPSQTAAFAKSSLAALLSVSNILFWRQTGYFDAPSATKPLLHTWSLAVEEQFYIFFPLFLIAMQRWFPGRLRAAIWTIAALTFALACLIVPQDATAAFFFSPLRAWELLIGTILSQRWLPPIVGAVWRNIAAAAGFLLILIPSVVYTSATQFPGLAALPPCLGTALLIAAGETGPSVVGRLLAWRPVAFIGLVSYSLYLWHWPLLVFVETNYAHVSGGMSWQLKLAIVAVSFGVAILSWRYIEMPFRSGPLRPDRRTLLAITGSAAMVVAAAGVYMTVSDGAPFRYSLEALAMDGFASYDPNDAFRTNVCFIDPKYKSTFANFDKTGCLKQDPARRQYLLLGDSHAAHLYPGLKSVFPELNFMQATASSCLPLMTQRAGKAGYCVGLTSYIYGDYLIRHHVAAIVLSGRWFERDFAELGRTVAWIRQRGIKVIVVGPNIEFDASLPQLLALSAAGGRDSGVVERHRNPEPMLTDRKLADLAANQWKVRYVSVYQNLCGGDSSPCPAYAAPGVPLLFDGGHFTVEGSILLAKTMRVRNQLAWDIPDRIPQLIDGKQTAARTATQRRADVVYK